MSIKQEMADHRNKTKKSLSRNRCWYIVVAAITGTMIYYHLFWMLVVPLTILMVVYIEYQSQYDWIDEHLLREQYNFPECVRMGYNKALQKECLGVAPYPLDCNYCPKCRFYSLEDECTLVDHIIELEESSSNSQPD